NMIAQSKFNELVYGAENIRAKNILGTTASVGAITLDDLKAFYAKSMSPSVARMHIVGDLNQAKILDPLSGMNKRWAAKKVVIPNPPTPAAPAKAQVYFHDVPGAVQSVFRVGYPALSQVDKDFYPAVVMNYILGGGGFASRLTQELREGKGYTYGINSGFAGTEAPGPFTIQSGIRANVTLEAAQLIKNIIDQYPKTFSEADLAT